MMYVKVLARVIEARVGLCWKRARVIMLYRRDMFG